MGNVSMNLPAICKNIPCGFWGVSHETLIFKLDYQSVLYETAPSPQREQAAGPHIWFTEENREQAPAEMGSIWEKEQFGVWRRVEDLGATRGKETVKNPARASWPSLPFTSTLSLFPWICVAFQRCMGLGGWN